MQLTEEERQIITEYAHPYFTPQDVEEWLNIDLQHTNQMQDYMRFTGASAYLEAVRAALRSRERR